MNYVFDFGAVLFTWRPADFVKTYFPERASTPEQAGQLAHDMFHHDDWQNFDRGTVAMADVIERMAQRLLLPAPAVDSLVSGIGELLTPMQDTVALLDDLRQQRETRSEIRLYYLSNMPEPYARALQQKHAFLDWFDGGIFSGDVQHIKPEPAIFELLENRYDLNPARTVFIDDLPSNVEAARRRGWHGIHFETADQLKTAVSLLQSS